MTFISSFSLRSLSLSLSLDYVIRSLICEFGFVVVQVSGEEDRQPIQCGDIEAFDHEQSQQSAPLPLATHTAREGQGSLLVLIYLVNCVCVIEMYHNLFYYIELIKICGFQMRHNPFFVLN